jgi:hypothetical protein
MTQTLNAPTHTPTRESYDRALARLEPILDQAIAVTQQVSAIAAEMNVLVDEMGHELSNEQMDAFFDSWFNSEPYKKLESLDAMIHKAVWG